MELSFDTEASFVEFTHNGVTEADCSGAWYLKYTGIQSSKREDGDERSYAGGRKAIIRKAKELNYRPNPLAVALKRGRKGAIGVFLHSMGIPGSELAHELLKSVSTDLRKSGERLVLRHFEEDEEFLNEVRSQTESDVDGLIVAGVNHLGIFDCLEELESNGLPVVYVSSSGIHTRSVRATIVVDYDMQGYLPTEHLLKKGCRNIAHIGTIAPRALGFRNAHERAGIPVNEKLVVEQIHDFTVASGVQFAEKLLASRQKFDAVVAQSDGQAVGVMRVLLKKGLRIPEDVRITGVDNSPFCDISQVPLTSVTAEMAECGRVAVQMLNDKIEGKAVNRTIVMPHLVIRESSA